MEMIYDAQFMGQLGIGIFLSIVFLQSGIDKITDWSGNQSWLTDHFSKTILSPLTNFMLGVLTIVELSAGLFSLCGVVCLIFCQDETCLYYGLLIAMLALLMLIFGQRIAKDYEGAKTIAIYFGVALVGLLFF